VVNLQQREEAVFNFGGVSWDYTPNGVWVVLEHGFEVYLCEHYLPVSIIMDGREFAFNEAICTCQPEDGTQP